MKFTKQQLEDWKVYEEVRQEGRYNMFDPRARALTGLDQKRYAFAMDNYSALQEAVKEGAS